jgi:hypothetical protein
MVRKGIRAYFFSSEKGIANFLIDSVISFEAFFFKSIITP